MRAVNDEEWEMVKSVNKITLIGKVVKQHELRRTLKGDAVVNMLLVTEECWKDSETGGKVKNAEWHYLVSYKRPAEIADNYLQVGDWAYVEGRIRTRKTQDKEGKEVFRKEILVKELIRLSERHYENEVSGNS